MPNFDDLVSKVKDVTKQAADKTSKAAKLARLRMEIMSLNAEKSRYLQSIGSKSYDLYTQNKKIDGDLFLRQVMVDLEQISRINIRLNELTKEIESVQGGGDDIEIKDVTTISDSDK